MRLLPFRAKAPARTATIQPLSLIASSNRCNPARRLRRPTLLLAATLLLLALALEALA